MGSLIKPTDVLVLVCRGVEWCEIKHRWLPCGYIQEARRGSWPDGSEKRERTGRCDPRLHKLEDFAIDSPDTWLAGTEASIYATVLLLVELKRRGCQIPKLLVISGGKPEYLKKWPTGDAPSEGAVAKQYLVDELETYGVPNPLPGLEVLVNQDGKNTEDDVANAVLAAHERGLKTVTFVNCVIAMARTIAFWGKVRAEHPEYAKSGISVRFLTTEEILEASYSENLEDDPSLLADHMKMLARVRVSNAWRFTEAQELIGLQKLVEKTYTAKGGY